MRPGGRRRADRRTGGGGGHRRARGAVGLAGGEYTTQGATLANIRAFGPNFGLGDDPRTQAYYGYQPSNYYSDFVYGDLKARLTDSWTLQDTVYTDSFEHKYTESSDASDTSPKDVGVTYYSVTKMGSKLSPQPAGAATDIPGKWTDAKLRAYGNILRMTGDMPFGAVKFGLWYEQNNDKRWSQGTDLTQGNVPVFGRGVRGAVRAGPRLLAPATTPTYRASQAYWAWTGR